jgi:predicted molibdopterin-dependent oxidoreductase YjgC
MMYAAEQGALKALFVIGGNLWSDETGMSTRRALEQCEFVAVCDVMASEGSHYADVLLPGVSFAEKSGTYTNTERRIQLARKAIEPQGDARAGWQVISDLAHRILTLSGRAPDGSYAAWTYATTGEIMKEIAALTPIYAGVSHERLERGDVLMWPVYSYADSGSPILFGTSFPVGKGKFVPVG